MTQEDIEAMEKKLEELMKEKRKKERKEIEMLAKYKFAKNASIIIKREIMELELKIKEAKKNHKEKEFIEKEFNKITTEDLYPKDLEEEFEKLNKKSVSPKKLVINDYLIEDTHRKKHNTEEFTSEDVDNEVLKMIESTDPYNGVFTENARIIHDNGEEEEIDIKEHKIDRQEEHDESEEESEEEDI